MFSKKNYPKNSVISPLNFEYIYDQGIKIWEATIESGDKYLIYQFGPGQPYKVVITEAIIIEKFNTLEKAIELCQKIRKEILEKKRIKL